MFAYSGVKNNFYFRGRSYHASQMCTLVLVYCGILHVSRIVVDCDQSAKLSDLHLHVNYVNFVLSFLTEMTWEKRSTG